MIVLPGGMPGTTNLYADKRVTDAVRKCYDEGKYVAAICAAPSVILGGMGLLKGRKATCYPGMEDGMTGATPLERTCVVDGRIITACGVGGALDFRLCAGIRAVRRGKGAPDRGGSRAQCQKISSSCAAVCSRSAPGSRKRRQAAPPTGRSPTVCCRAMPTGCASCIFTYVATPQEIDTHAH